VPATGSSILGKRAARCRVDTATPGIGQKLPGIRRYRPFSAPGANRSESRSKRSAREISQETTVFAGIAAQRTGILSPLLGKRSDRVTSGKLFAVIGLGPRGLQLFICRQSAGITWHRFKAMPVIFRAMPGIARMSGHFAGAAGAFSSPR